MWTRTRPFGIPAAIALGAITASAPGQSLNIDFDDTAGVPAASYAAAGLPGLWNPIPIETGALHPLANLRGDATSATVTFNLGFAVPADDPGTMGDDAHLLDDGLSGIGDVVVTVTIEGLRPAHYKLITYGWTPNQPGDTTLLLPEWDPSAGTVLGGAWPGKLTEGITHATLTADADSGQITMGFVGGHFGATGFMNAMQLRRMTPADVDDDGLVGVTDMLRVLGAWGPCACPEDVNGDGVVNVHDLLAVLHEWD